MTLYELTGNYLAIMEMLENEEITSEDVKDTLEAIEEGIEAKAENIGFVIKNLEAETSMLETEIKRLAERKTRAEKSTESLKNYMSDSLLKLDYKTLKTNHFTYGFRKSTAVEIDNLELLPKEFVKEKITIAPDKAALKVALKDNEVPGARLVEEQSLQLS